MAAFRVKRAGRFWGARCSLNPQAGCLRYDSQVAKVGGDLQQTRHARKTGSCVRAALLVAGPSTSPCLHPELPLGVFELSGSPGAGMETWWLRGQPVLVSLSLTLFGSGRSVNFFQRRIDHQIARLPLEAFGAITVNHGSIELVRGQFIQATMGANRAAKAGQRPGEFVGGTPALTKGAAKGAAKGATNSPVERRAQRAMDGEAVHVDGYQARVNQRGQKRRMG